MRWDALFRDMEVQLAAAAGMAAESEISERVRIEMRGIRLQDRLCGQYGRQLVLDMGAAGSLHGVLRHVGEGWVVLEQDRRAVLAVLSHVVSISGMDRFSSSQTDTLRFGVASALRSIARDRSDVSIRFGGAGSERSLHGTIDRVGGDFVELAAVPTGLPRRSANVSGVFVLPMASLAAVVSQHNSLP